MTPQPPTPSPEAQAFLATLSPKRQQTQVKAIQRALEGDLHLLHLMRNLRIRDAKLPDSTPEIEVATTTLADHLAAVYTPRHTPPKGTILYLHGGGWVIGSIHTCAQVCHQLAATTNQRIIALDYPLAPENPFPKPLQTILEATRQIRRQYGGRLIAAGDSAGGNLALALERHHPLDALLLYYPVTHAIADQRPSWQHFATIPSLDATLMETFNQAYAPLHLRQTHPDLSPLVEQPIRAPHCPVLLVAAPCDILADQGLAYARQIKQTGADIHYRQIPGSVHLFMTMPGQPNARRQALHITADFLAARTLL
ncbi:MAG: alpha/beta hydrolase fold domain-containing protein [Kiritimatiellia bacterium]